MAKIRKFNANYVNLKGEQRQYETYINYAVKKQEFYISVPQDIAQQVGQSVKGKTEEAAVNAFEQFCKEAREKVTTRRKVIIFYWTARAPMKLYRGNFNKSYRISSVLDPRTLEFRYIIAVAVTLAGDAQLKGTAYYEIGEDGETSDEKPSSRTFLHQQAEATVLPWTQEAQDFFKSFDDGFSALIRKFADFFGDDRKWIDKLDGSIKLFPDPDILDNNGRTS